MDALGAPQSVLLLGGTSEIGLAVLRRLPRTRLRRLVLAGRDRGTLAVVAKSLAAEGFPDADVIVVEATDTEAHQGLVDAVFDAGDVDLTVLAIGALGDQAAAEQDPRQAIGTLRASYLGPASLTLHVGRRLRGQGHGTLVVLSSMAAVQARRSNFVYGSAKAGLDALALGLGDALAPDGVRVVVVRPGFVRTRMTRDLRPAPLATTADAVARRVVDGVRRGRTVVYAPPSMAVLATALRVLPRRVLRRLPF
jgi:decaprenylphospho-beta-D-erythro-pentofuranosid-2-ulose 2-reductase